MSLNDALGTRMKEYYEGTAQTYLVRRMPVAIRIDGKAFHTFTKGLKKPFDDVLINTMQRTTRYLCENIQGCVFGYTQSDEISLILVDYNKLETDAWFGYKVQKVVSVAASMATMAFNKFFDDEVNKYLDSGFDKIEKQYVVTLLNKASESKVMFDARCFNIPKEEVVNLIYWRQLDATRNSVNMVAQSIFSHKELQNKSCVEIKEMLLSKALVNWNDYSPVYKYGTACIKKDTGWILDKDMPILKGENRNYLENLI